MVIQSAVVPVAGLGTRLLTATKSQPKEMLPVARKPIVQYVVEELVANGIQQILFVTGRGKASIENHFDHDPELFRTLSEANKHELLKELDPETLRANFFYTRQRLQKGLGDAVLCGEGRRVMAVKLPAHEKRYDIGNFPSYFESFVEFALADPEYGPALRRVLERLLAKQAAMA